MNRYGDLKADMANRDVGLDTTINQFFGERRLLFARRRPLLDCLIEWALPVLWFLVAIVVAASVWFLS